MAMRAVSKTVNPGSNPGSPASSPLGDISWIEPALAGRGSDR